MSQKTLIERQPELKETNFDKPLRDDLEDLQPDELDAIFSSVHNRFGHTVLFDTETTCLDKEKMRLTTIQAISTQTRQIHSYDLINGEEVVGLFGMLLDSACTIAAHNSFFDNETALGLYFPPEKLAEWRRKMIDHFETIKHLEGSWIGVNALCQIAGVTTKIADGAGAIEMWNEGNFKALREYCAVDVIVLLLLWARDRIHFCCKRPVAKGKPCAHVGSGFIDRDTLTVTTCIGVDQTPMLNENSELLQMIPQPSCPCDIVWQNYNEEQAKRFRGDPGLARIAQSLQSGR
jgi:hypothetical protein